MVSSVTMVQEQPTAVPNHTAATSTNEVDSVVQHTGPAIVTVLVLRNITWLYLQECLPAREQW